MQDEATTATKLTAESQSARADGFALGATPPKEARGSLGGSLGAGTQTPLFTMMLHVRWGHWARAKETLTTGGLHPLTAEQQGDAVLQLANVYKMENNVQAGRAACDRLLGTPPSASLAACMDRLVTMPRRVQMALVVGDQFPAWLDVPAWQRLPSLAGTGEVPLWLVGPAGLPAVVRVRVSVPPRASGTLKLWLKGADLAEAKPASHTQHPASTPADAHGEVQTIEYQPQQVEDGWFEFRVNMREWNVMLGIEMGDNRS